jgi:hypothetical protein
MDLLSKFKKAAIEEEAVLIKDYFKTNFTWQNVLDFVYDQTCRKNIDLEIKSRDSEAGVDVFGNVLAQRPFWIAPQTGLVWEYFTELKDFLIKINQESGFSQEFANCNYYKHWDARSCNCESLWHTEGIKVSLGEKFVGEHSDPWPACYLQSIGTSFWEIKGKNSKTTYELNSGDLLFFPKNTTHKVWAKGPRVGFLVNADISKPIAKDL